MEEGEENGERTGNVEDDVNRVTLKMIVKMMTGKSVLIVQKINLSIAVCSDSDTKSDK